ncbi:MULTISPECIES: hypothetical protein [unclassified Spirosoma]|uniref:hypothetical protein n=1 Tax=unclassified Spirosoma TaxID=2621999 RepID=UPI00095B5E2B|nr:MULTISPECIES: hypothetical protein [unclassified Spirosoma]MBN8824439.1 hypothetical protein [Spirosoma sp.]OJW70098.1 MAG: hypothetical protein BGO59_25830 [Spirosoma sp. 48-14]
MLTLSNCVRVEQKPVTLEQVDSAKLAMHVDSAAIYRCDTCAFAVAYLKQASGQVKPCPSCPWVTLTKPKHNKGDVPELSNQPVNPLIEQDALQHGTSHLVVVDTLGQPPSRVAQTSPALRPGDDITVSSKTKSDGF